jgi:hypothetical protein
MGTLYNFLYSRDPSLYLFLGKSREELMISVLFSFFLSSAAWAVQTPSPHNLFYNPHIVVKKFQNGWSLYGCKIERVELQGLDPVSKLPRKVFLTLYNSMNRSLNAVILLPPTGGVNILDRGYANKLCSANINVALLDRWEHQQEASIDFSMHDHGALRFLSATRHTVEFLSAMQMNSIGLLGTSIGAIGGALAFGIDQRISVATFIVGSARFADVIAFSDESVTTQLREARMELYGLSSINEYRDLVQHHVKIEPSNYLKNISSTKTALVITADQDTTVPSEFQHELAHILNATEIRLKGNHLKVIKNTFLNHSDRIVQFFNNAFGKMKK